MFFPRIVFQVLSLVPFFHHCIFPIVFLHGFISMFFPIFFLKSCFPVFSFSRIVFLQFFFLHNSRMFFFQNLRFFQNVFSSIGFSMSIFPELYFANFFLHVITSFFPIRFFPELVFPGAIYFFPALYFANFFPAPWFF